MNAIDYPSTDSDAVSVDERQLLGALQRGEQEAFVTLVHHYSPRMMAVTRRFFKCEQTANDALQDAFVSVSKAIGKFEGQSQLGTWLHRITVNACLMKLRASSRRTSVSIDELLPSFDETGHQAQPSRRWAEEDASAILEAEEMRERVRACIEQLPEGFREVLLLRDIEEMSTEEAAEVMGLSEMAVKTRLHRARQALRTLLDPIMALNE